MSAKRMILDDEWLKRECETNDSPKAILRKYNACHGTDIRYGTFYEYLKVKLNYRPIRANDWNDVWISENYSKFKDLNSLWEEYCSIEKRVKFDAFKAHCVRKLGLYSSRWWSDKEIDFLIENYPNLRRSETTRLLNESFGNNRDMTSVVNMASRLNLNINNDVIEQNRDKPTKKIGEEITDGDSPYIRVKTEKGWVRKHRVEYERKFGSIPKGYNIIFLDKNSTNCSPDNLFAVSNKVLMQLQANGLRGCSKEITKTGIRLCVLGNIVNGDIGNYEKDYLRCNGIN